MKTAEAGDLCRFVVWAFAKYHSSVQQRPRQLHTAGKALVRVVQIMRESAVRCSVGEVQELLECYHTRTWSPCEDTVCSCPTTISWFIYW